MKGLDALFAVVSTPSCAPVIAAARLRNGSANSARGAHRFVTDALVTARKAGATGMLVLRADSPYYGHDVIFAAARRPPPAARRPPPAATAPRRPGLGPRPAGQGRPAAVAGVSPPTPG